MYVKGCDYMIGDNSTLISANETISSIFPFIWTYKIVEKTPITLSDGNERMRRRDYIFNANFESIEFAISNDTNSRLSDKFSIYSNYINIEPNTAKFHIETYNEVVLKYEFRYIEELCHNLFLLKTVYRIPRTFHTLWFETNLTSHTIKTNIVMLFHEFRDICVDIVRVIIEHLLMILREDFGNYTCVNS
jgi:hypothetical protein